MNRDMLKKVLVGAMCFVLGVVLATVLSIFVLGNHVLEAIDKGASVCANEVVEDLYELQKKNEIEEARKYLKEHPIVFPCDVRSWDEWMGWLRTVDLSLDYPPQHEHEMRMGRMLDQYEEHGFETIVYTIPYGDFHGDDGFVVEMDEMMILYNATHETKVYWWTENDIVMTVYIGREFYNEEVQASLDSWEQSTQE